MDTPPRPSLPPENPDQDRQAQIAKRRSLRPYEYTNPVDVAAIGVASPFALPPEDQIKPPYMLAGALTHMHMRRHFMSLPMGRFFRAADLIEPLSPLKPPQPPPAMPDTINDITNAAPKAPAASLDVFAALAAGLEPIPLLERLGRHPGERDALFGYQRVAGPNPYILQRLSSAAGVPGHFPVTEAHFQRAMGTLRPLGSGGDTLERARSEGRLFLVDCRALDNIPAEKFIGRQKYLAAAMGLFVRPLDGASALLPVAIQCGQRPAEAPVFTPGDGWRWRLAQAFLSSAEGALHEAGEHLALTHLVAEAFALAARRNLADTHPVAVLLEPHFEGTHFINTTARHNLIKQDGTLDRMMAPDVSITGEVARHMLEGFSVEEGDPRSRLRARGLLDPDGLTESPFREDALPLWDALYAWVGDYLKVYYPDASSVANDVELQAFVTELAAREGGRLRGVPEVRDLVPLTHVLTLAVFTGSVHHAAVNFPQYPFMGYVPNMPGALYQPPPTLETPDTEASLLAAMPPLDAAVLQMYTVWQLSSVRSNHLGDYPNVTDPQVGGALQRLRRRLAEIEREILAREPGRPLPYPYLRPSLLPASIII